MAIKIVNASSRRFTFGFPGADYPVRDTAIQKARKYHTEAIEKYGDKVREQRFEDESLQVEDTSVWAKITFPIEV